MAFAFQVMTYTLGTVMVLGIISDAFSIFENIASRSLDVYEIGVVAIGLMMFGLYVMHLYLLFTVKPIDENEKADGLLKAME